MEPTRRKFSSQTNPGLLDRIRDKGALEAALFRPQTGYYRDVIKEAAALLESVVQNRPFVDGNTRVGPAVRDVLGVLRSCLGSSLSKNSGSREF